MRDWQRLVADLALALDHDRVRDAKRRLRGDLLPADSSGGSRVLIIPKASKKRKKEKKKKKQNKKKSKKIKIKKN